MRSRKPPTTFAERFIAFLYITKLLLPSILPIADPKAVVVILLNHETNTIENDNKIIKNIELVFIFVLLTSFLNNFNKIVTHSCFLIPRRLLMHKLVGRRDTEICWTQYSLIVLVHNKNFDDLSN